MKPSQKPASAGFFARITFITTALWCGGTLPVQGQTQFSVKWDQPPVTAHRTNIFNGWNQYSVRGFEYAADDWACTTPSTVTGVRWWGSFINWTSNTPPAMPAAFFITIWTDVPSGPNEPFSHPGRAVHQVVTTSFQWECAGMDYDPRNGMMETCFVFEDTWSPDHWFKQNPANGTNIYWISIEAFYPNGPGPFPWGWKTRPRDPESLAPDAAVSITAPLAPVVNSSYEKGDPIYWPVDRPWDLAFELLESRADDGDYKWEQLPDISRLGIDVNASIGEPPYLLADDFRCTTPGPITNITIWGSWLGDKLPTDAAGNENPSNVVFTISIHEDLPADKSPTGYSMPTNLVALWTFAPGEFSWRRYAANIEEGWLNPPTAYFPPPADTVCHEYHFPIRENIFVQEGTPNSPRVYWIDVQARPLGISPAETRFGWKTSITNWNDAAVWINALEPFAGVWHMLRYPPNHPKVQTNLDLAFRINTARTNDGDGIKWSQPPVIAQSTNFYHGWDEPSLHGSQQIVADDWVCTTPDPVSDIHWWGSFLGWTGRDLPPEPPSGFVVSIWTDVPPTPTTPFSHPGKVIHQVRLQAASPRFVGWDIDPRATGCLEVESTFKWDYELNPADWFKQPEGTNIFWVSIAAVYPTGMQPRYPWGWKTRPRDPTSPAPDDAVIVLSPTAPEPDSEYQTGRPIEFPPGKSWDMAFTLTSPFQEPELDFGDAPQTTAAPGYPTLLLFNGARHQLSALRMGPLIDTEPDGQPNANATGDDLANLDDEDGVIFLTNPLLTGQPGSVAVLASAPGRLHAWIDWDADGSWSQPADHVLAGVAVIAGPNLLSFPVPATAALGTTFARFRLSTAAALSYDGLAPDGEVEDYTVVIAKEPGSAEFDFGDAPTNNYPTLLAHNGARHIVLLAPGSFVLGTNIDMELDGQPNPSAMGDDLNGIDDEDGVVFLTPLRRGSNACVSVTLNSIFGNGLLDAWVDFDRNGTWDHPAEQIAASQNLVNGPNLLCFSVPSKARIGRTYARFRLSSYGGLLPPGPAQNGEVEDYVASICQNAPTNVVITNIAVTNILVAGVVHQQVTLRWIPEPDTTYQLQSVPDLQTIPLPWTDEGPEVTAPQYSVTFTNPPAFMRLYRLKAPGICP